MLRAAFQGVRGAYSEEAVRQLFGDDVELVPLESFADVFRAVEKGIVDRGVIPIENSLTGSIHQNFDLLLKRRLWITGETKVRIRHHLIAHKGVKFSEIRKIYSHPQGLAQCEKFLGRLKKIEKIPAFDTAGSVRMIRENNERDAAAIASKQAAVYYDMDILREGIEDVEENYTRFFMLSKKKEIAENADKTTIVYSLASSNEPGTLFKSLSVFALRDLNLLKIESRPVHGKPWEYYFYVDVEINLNDKKGKNAVSHLKEIATHMKILGCYPKA